VDNLPRPFPLHPMLPLTLPPHRPHPDIKPSNSRLLPDYHFFATHIDYDSTGTQPTRQAPACHPTINQSCANQATCQVTCLFLVPMAPTSQPNLLLLLCWDLPCLPRLFNCDTNTPFGKELPYVYKCSCDNNKPPSPLSHSSFTINNDAHAPHQFNGAMFGQVFSSPIPKSPQVPIIVYRLPAPTISAAPTLMAVVQGDTKIPPLFPNAPTLKVQLCPIALWVLCLDKTFTLSSLLPQHQSLLPILLLLMPLP
jgi:hypothetical protein